MTKLAHLVQFECVFMLCLGVGPRPSPSDLATPLTRRLWQFGLRFRGYVLLDTELLERISEYAARAYTTPASAVSYLNHAQMA